MCHFVLVFFSPFSIAIYSLVILVLFVRLFGLCLFRFVGFLFLLGSGKGCGLWLWHSLDFSLTFFFKYSKVDPLLLVFLFCASMISYVAVYWHYLSQHMTKPTKWHVRPANTQIDLGIRLVWSESVRMKKALVLSYPLNAQRRLWSDWADAQADLSLRLAHMPFCRFCRALAQFYSSPLPFCASKRLCILIVAFPGCLRLYFLTINFECHGISCIRVNDRAKTVNDETKWDFVIKRTEPPRDWFER